LAREGGKLVSFDPNYSRRIWPDHKEARKVLCEAYEYVDVTRPSLDGEPAMRCALFAREIVEMQLERAAA
jgi:sugar/nucleoside kinase (ribokinase family)